MRFAKVLLLVFFCSLGVAKTALALPPIVTADSANAYIYIQGDKSIPFYVRIGKTMCPRYGKNYSLITGLGEGNTQIEILFQQRTYPSVFYTITIHNGDARALYLQKQGENFILKDLKTGYIFTPDKKDK